MIDVHQLNLVLSRRRRFCAKGRVGNFINCYNLVPRGPFCHALEISGPLARPNDISVLNGCVNTID